MFTKTAHFVRNADQFGAIYKPSFNLHQASYKTVFGGLLTLLIYSLSLSYVIYEFYLWREGDFLPKITTIKTTLKDFQFYFDSLAHFHLRNHLNKSKQSSLDPFEDQKIILAPVIYTVLDGIPSSPVFLTKRSFDDDHGTITIEVTNLEMRYRDESDAANPSIEYLVSFEPCRAALLPAGFDCASQELVNKFFEQTANQLVVKNYVQQYNIQAKRFEEVVDEYFVAFDNETTYFSQCTYDVAKILVDNGLILADWEAYLVPAEINHITQNMDIDYFAQYLGVKSYMLFQFEISVIQEVQMIEFQKVSQIFADVGSIISIIFFVSYLALLVNEKRLEDEANKLVVEIFYPEMEQIEIKRDWRGRVTEVSHQKKRKIDLEKFKIKYERLLAVAREKLTVVNQIYETSRIQFCLGSMVARDFITKSHKWGIDLELLQEEQLEERNALGQRIEDAEKLEGDGVEQGKCQLGEPAIKNDLEQGSGSSRRSVVVVRQEKFLHELRLVQEVDEIKLTHEDYNLLTRSYKQQLKVEN